MIACSVPGYGYCRGDGCIHTRRGRDQGLKDAAAKVSDAVRALTGNLAARERDHAKLEADLNAAIGSCAVRFAGTPENSLY